MCGRFVSTTSSLSLAKFFDVDFVEERLIEVAPRYNIAPTSTIRVVLEQAETRILTDCRWGLVPSWAKDKSVGVRMINARSETLATKPSFRSAFARRRCIITVDGFYEWKKPVGTQTNQPYFIFASSGEPLAFAGLWEEWKDTTQEPTAESFLRTCTIITTQANQKVSELHDRMPVVLQPQNWEQWLSPLERRVDALQELLVPAPEDLLDFFAVSTEVNNARNQGEQLLAPL